MQHREMGAKQQAFPVVGKWLIVLGVVLLAIVNL